MTGRRGRGRSSVAISAGRSDRLGDRRRSSLTLGPRRRDHRTVCASPIPTTRCGCSRCATGSRGRAGGMSRSIASMRRRVPDALVAAGRSAARGGDLVAATPLVGAAAADADRADRRAAADAARRRWRSRRVLDAPARRCRTRRGMRGAARAAVGAADLSAAADADRSSWLADRAGARRGGAAARPADRAARRARRAGAGALCSRSRSKACRSPRRSSASRRSAGRSIQRARGVRCSRWSGACSAARWLLHIATRGPAMLAPACDAMAPALARGARRRGDRRDAGDAAARESACAARRAGAGGIGAAATLLVGRAGAACAGPFATLDPLVVPLWYVNVAEGLPLWEQTPDWAVMTIGLPIVGLVGSVLACAPAQGEARSRWTMLLAAARRRRSLLSLLVNRAGATANALACRARRALLLALLTRARAIVAGRCRALAATAGALLVASPGLAVGASCWSLARRSRRHGRGDRATRGAARASRRRRSRDSGACRRRRLRAARHRARSLATTAPPRDRRRLSPQRARRCTRVLAAFTGSPSGAQRIVRAAAPTMSPAARR